MYQNILARFLKILGLSLLPFFLLSCGNVGKMYNPLDWNERHSLASSEAWVVVGSYSQEAGIHSLIQWNKGINYGEWVVPLPAIKLSDVYLFPVPIGHTFWINDIRPRYFETREGDKERLGSWHHTFKINDPKKIKIERPGIYYYTGYVIKGDNIYLEALDRNTVIEAAKRKYPNAFEQLESVNF